MSAAICFKCGSRKDGAFEACPSCGSVGLTQNEFAISLALSGFVSDEAQLQVFAKQIRATGKCLIPDLMIALAHEALQDPQLRQMAVAASASASPRIPGKTSSAPPAGAQARQAATQRTRKPTATELHRNAFAVLGASTRDSRQRIIELAEEKSLVHDNEMCSQARSDLTNPRTRLSAEIGWLPGLSPRKASQLLEKVHEDPLSLRDVDGLPVLAHANLLSASFDMVDSKDDAETVALLILQLAELTEQFSAETVQREVNEDRSVAGFPEVRSEELVQAALSERKRGYKGAVKRALDRLPPHSIIEAMTAAVDAATDSGESHAPELIDDLVDGYEVETSSLLDREAQNIDKLAAAVRGAAGQGEAAVKPLIDKVVQVATNWDKVAQPIQLSAKARGIEHGPSTKVAYSLRKLAIDLFNDHDLIASTKRLTDLMQELFSELPEFLERVEQDADALDDIFIHRKEMTQRRAEWEKAITYSADVGILFKDRLSISPSGVEWKQQRFSLDSITRIRWGAVSRSVNGVPTGTEYTIAFGDQRSEAVAECRKEAVFSEFVDKLWRAVGVRLLTSLFERLQAGEEVSIGEAAVRDDGVTLTKRKWFSSERVRRTWDQVHVWTANGSFFIGDRSDKAIYAEMPYLTVNNAHVLEHAIRVAFKTPGMRVLSDVLDED